RPLPASATHRCRLRATKPHNNHNAVFSHRKSRVECCLRSSKTHSLLIWRSSEPSGWTYRWCAIGIRPMLGWCTTSSITSMAHGWRTDYGESRRRVLAVFVQNCGSEYTTRLVVGEKAVISDNVSILHNVMLGAPEKSQAIATRRLTMASLWAPSRRHRDFERCPD
ncbi:hypothetical protein Taro_024570, partial [Colocasia esculenta]|nr:hypothetical protein [Colocasia esculenta]